eukprot:gene2650-1648_t
MVLQCKFFVWEVTAYGVRLHILGLGWREFAVCDLVERCEFGCCVFDNTLHVRRMLRGVGFVGCYKMTVMLMFNKFNFLRIYCYCLMVRYLLVFAKLDKGCEIVYLLIVDALVFIQVIFVLSLTWIAYILELLFVVLIFASGVSVYLCFYCCVVICVAFNCLCGVLIDRHDFWCYLLREPRFWPSLACTVYGTFGYLCLDVGCLLNAVMCIISFDAGCFCQTYMCVICDEFVGVSLYLEFVVTLCVGVLCLTLNFKGIMDCCQEFVIGSCVCAGVTVLMLRIVLCVVDSSTGCALIGGYCCGDCGFWWSDAVVFVVLQFKVVGCCGSMRLEVCDLLTLASSLRCLGFVCCPFQICCYLCVYGGLVVVGCFTGYFADLIVGYEACD